LHHLPTCCYAWYYYFVYVLIQNILSIIHNLFLAEDPLHKDPLSVLRPEEVLE
jgi:hypothetical protein